MSDNHVVFSGTEHRAQLSASANAELSSIEEEPGIVRLALYANLVLGTFALRNLNVGKRVLDRWSPRRRNYRQSMILALFSVAHRYVPGHHQRF